jgi:hypothetical protein
VSEAYSKLVTAVVPKKLVQARMRSGKAGSRTTSRRKTPPPGSVAVYPTLYPAAFVYASVTTLLGEIPIPLRSE